MGLSFFIVVAGTDDEAKKIAARSYKEWHRSFHYLYHLNNRSPVFGERTSDFEVLSGQGRAIAGTPETVRAFLAAQIRESGINYLVGQFMFGDMTYAEASASVDLFGRHVMPKLKAAV
jgi:alkanesulfonate monooxygenase SsuD/methylene tetrahydromethanopterin reductase-like flavin-dependent oxidoreductase (luciferase family)